MRTFKFGEKVAYYNNGLRQILYVYCNGKPGPNGVILLAAKRFKTYNFAMPSTDLIQAHVNQIRKLKPKKDNSVLYAVISSDGRVLATSTDKDTIAFIHAPLKVRKYKEVKDNE